MIFGVHMAHCLIYACGMPRICGEKDKFFGMDSICMHLFRVHDMV